jgi:AcrR family transcriptional regulator
MAVNASGAAGDDIVPRPPGAKSQRRRQQILDAALRLFSERPYDDVFVEEIARAADVAKGLMFYHFKDKQGLYIAATERQVDLEMAQWREPGEADRPRAHIRDVLFRHFAYLEHHSFPYLNMMRRRPGIPDVEEIFERARLESITITLGHLDLDLDLDARGRAAMRGWVAFNDEITVNWLEHGGLTADDVTDLSLSMLTAALETLLDRYPQVAPAVDELRKAS